MTESNALMKARVSANGEVYKFVHEYIRVRESTSVDLQHGALGTKYEQGKVIALMLTPQVR